MRPQPECPECEKLAKVSEESNKIGDFINWLQRHEMQICNWEDNEYYPSYQGDSGINRILANYFDIDLDKVEQERRELLKWLQEEQA